MSELLAVTRKKYNALASYLDEATLRIWAASEARSLARGGIAIVAEATRLSRRTIERGLRQLGQAPVQKRNRAVRRVRAVGGGRKRLTQNDPVLLRDLEALVEPTTRGDPESPLRWTSKSTTKLAEELKRQGHAVSQRTVCELLHQQHYSLQATRKTLEGSGHPDRDAQFRHIAGLVLEFQQSGQPVISVDAKKKELVGDFANKGQEWRPKGEPVPVRVYDFVDEELGKVNPYGIYDLAANEGWVNVGIDHDTAEFAVESIRRWWREMGRQRYPQAGRLLITADGGGSNGSRVRLWKVQLQLLADEVGLDLRVCHFPPGTSKWNKIEHRMFCHISQNWRGRPLTSRQVVVNLIGQTTTAQGLKIRASLDENTYAAGRKVSQEEMAALAIERDAFQGNWNYTIKPRK
jgi:hypothetical protein